jgi:hypothetical protein
LSWDAKQVKFQLAQAYRVLQTAPLRGDYRLGGGGFWPQVYYTRDEIKEQQRMLYGQAAKRSNKRYGPREIKIMESVLCGQGDRKGWLAEWLADKPGAQRCLAQWAIWCAQDRNIKHECIIKGWAYSTFRRKRDQAAKLLADRLTAARVEVF